MCVVCARTRTYVNAIKKEEEEADMLSASVELFHYIVVDFV